MWDNADIKFDIYVDLMNNHSDQQEKIDASLQDYMDLFPDEKDTWKNKHIMESKAYMIGLSRLMARERKSLHAQDCDIPQDYLYDCRNEMRRQWWIGNGYLRG